ncbi:DNA polymerase III subunit gamma/tau [Betaproteobacteria bacterium SCN2]|jgi:DNA polymerase-3 subunit gamma/tau|nr:DNA polymerase III subunit gamma/tau [Betaproteobacteria bacterium SCN2]
MTDLFGESSQAAVALARKWRPRRFADLTGQEHVVQALSNALTQGRLHHAYLFTGTRGVGKTTLARILAKCLNCETGVTPEPCGECSACRQIDAGRFVDLLELDAASNTGVDNMREVLDNAQYAPTVGRYKVYIIDEVHMLSKPAFNSMLKTLEEPPEHVKFILATTDPQKIPVTVLSRCLQFNLKPMTPLQVTQRLAHVLGEEGIAVEAAALSLLARAANGSMRDALSLTDQAIAHGSGKLESAAVEAMLGTVGQEYLFDILDALSRQDADALLIQPRLLAERGLSLSAALQDLGSLLTRIALAQAAAGALAEEQDAARVQEFAQKLDAETVQLYYQIALNGRRDLPFAPDELSGFSMTLLRMLAFSPAMDTARQPVSVARPTALAIPRAQLAQAAAEPPQALLAAEPSPPPVRTAPASPAQTETAQTGTAQAVPAQPGQDWPAIVADLRLGGMARMLADQCELKSFDGSVMLLGLAEMHRHLLDKVYQEKLEAALRNKFGTGLKVSIEVGASGGQSPVAVRARAKAEKQAEAVAAIETDPFIRDLVEQFDARVDPASIQPSGESQ